ncbi:MAG: family 20 glycosylhydrolase [Paracoccaceae bacterium]
MTKPHVTAHWAEGPQNGSFIITLHGAEALPSGYRLAYTSQLRTLSGAISGARLLQIDGSFHLVAPHAEGPLSFTLTNLSFTPKHANDGVMSAFLVLPDGTTQDIAAAPLTCDNPPVDTTPPPPPPPAPGLGITPMPAEISLTGTAVAPAGFALPPDASPALQAAFATAATLYATLFADHPQLFGTGPVTLAHKPVEASEGYTLRFLAGLVELHTSGPGLLYALITLAQATHHARQNPALFTYPAAGSTITDGPRFHWRGAHLDVARRFYPMADLRRFLAIMAWHKLNRFHWHLSDDEAWRIEIRAFPALIQTGATRGWGQAIPPLLGDSAAGQSGHYTQAEAAGLVAEAASLNIEVIPEIDIPAHSAATLRALPHLADPEEKPGSYISVHGFSNNALNPGLPATMAFVNTVLGELLQIFPAKVFHLGGDEVAPGAWATSPAAQRLNPRNSNAIQSAFMRHCQARLADKGRIMGGWDECAQGGGVAAESALLFAWQSADLAKMLTNDGYSVTFTPATAYYMDIAQSHGWADTGASWAGMTPALKTYETEPAAGVDLPAKLAGVQACIWSETLVSKAIFNHQVFPRLCAVAETGWSLPAAKDWPRFAALSAYFPRL